MHTHQLVGKTKKNIHMIWNVNLPCSNTDEINSQVGCTVIPCLPNQRPTLTHLEFWISEGVQPVLFDPLWAEEVGVCDVLVAIPAEGVESMGEL